MFSKQENKYLIRSHPLCLSMHYKPMPPDYHNTGPHNGGEHSIKTLILLSIKRLASKINHSALLRMRK